MLLSAFSDAIDSGKITSIKYIVVTAKLAEAYQRPELAKKYWTQVKLKAAKGTSAAELARKRLWANESLAEHCHHRCSSHPHSLQLPLAFGHSSDIVN